MANDLNKEVVIRFWAAFEADDRGALSEILAPDLVAHTPGAGQLDRETHLQGVSMFNAGISDRDFTVEEMIAEGDTVATRTTLRGTHTGDVHGHPPTGKRISATGLTMERIEDGKIVERWFNFDVAGVLKELGATMASHTN